MLNKVMLIGQCGKYPESRFFPSGDQQTTVSLATSRRWKDKNTGERKEKTSWHNLVFNRGLAKVAADYLKKGSKIYVEGEIDYQEWETDGVKKYMTRILVSEMHMLGGRGNQDQSDNSNHKSPSNETQTAAAYNDFDQDIPF